MRYRSVLLLSVFFLVITNLVAGAQAAPEAQATDSCASLTLPADIDRDETIKISRALDICDDLRKVFDRRQSTPRTLDLLQKRTEEKPLGADEVDRMLQQPGGQSQLLRQLADELEKGRDERNALAEELQNRLTVERISAKTAALASDSNRVRLQVQNVLTSRRAFEVETEVRRYQHTKFLNAFLGTTVSTVGTGLQLNDGLHVQHVGDVLGVVGGGLTAFFNICTADWNVPDPQPSDSLLFNTFASDNKGNLIPTTVWIP